MIIKKFDRSAKSLYELLQSDREPFLTRGRKCAELTIPALLPPSGHSKASALYTPNQSLGARGVNNLASKLLLSLIPPNTPFFRLLVDDFELIEMGGEDDRAKFEEALNDVERAVQTETERKALRTPVFMALKLLIAVGNALLYMPKDGKMRALRLDSYVVRRSPDGDVIDVILKEEIAYASLPKDLQAKLAEDPQKKYDPSDPVDVYTCFHLDDGKYYGWQEVEDITVDGSEGSWDKARAPFLALRWTAIDGEDYGRGHVEEYIGDLNHLEGLSEAILETSLAMAKAVILVRPGASTKIKSLAQAKNLDFVVGEVEDVGVVQLEKRADLSVAQRSASEVKQDLAQAFLLNGSVQRDAERVTAEEIRFMAAELEDALGGVYSLLAQEFQLPLVNRLMDLMTREKRLPKIPKGIVPSIVTGLEALGRGQDLSKLQVFSNEIAKFGPEKIDEELNVGDYFKRFGTGLGIDMDGLIYTPEEKEERLQQKLAQVQEQQMMDLAGKAAPAAIQAASRSESN